jgi:hypothetical protein
MNNCLSNFLQKIVHSCVSDYMEYVDDRWLPRGNALRFEVDSERTRQPADALFLTGATDLASQ